MPTFKVLQWCENPYVYLKHGKQYCDCGCCAELPWDRAELTCPEYAEWRSDSAQWMARSPWCKMDNLVLSLVRRILNPLPSQRLTIAKIREHRWLTKRHSQTKGA